MNLKMLPLAALCGAVALLTASGCGSGEGAYNTAEKKDAQSQGKEAGQTQGGGRPRQAVGRGSGTRRREGADAGGAAARRHAHGHCDRGAQRGTHSERHAAPAGPHCTVAVKLGDGVKQGQTLAVLESIEVGEAQSAYAQALAEASVAKTAFERAERLHAEQIIPGEGVPAPARGLRKDTRRRLQAATNKLKMLGVAPPKDGPASERSRPFR